MSALVQTAPGSDRTNALMEELIADHAHVLEQDDVSEEAMARKRRMLRNHRAYLKVLKYHTEKLQVLNDLPPPEQRQYDPKWVSVESQTQHKGAFSLAPFLSSQTWLSKVEPPNPEAAEGPDDALDDSEPE